MKKKLLSLALMTIFVSLMALGSAAYFTAEGRATNVITTGMVEMELQEMQLKDGEEVPYPNKKITGVMPCQTVSKIPYVVGMENSQPFYTRVKVDVTVTAADGATEMDNKYIALNYDTINWVQGSDGWWYYQDQMTAGDKVALFTEAAFDAKMPNEYQSCTVEIDVIAQAVQVKNNIVPVDANGIPDYTAIVGWPVEAAE